jgi:hypothetical protein
VQHVILTFDLTSKSGIILGATVGLPFVVAAAYQWMRTRHATAHAL